MFSAVTSRLTVFRQAAAQRLRAFAQDTSGSYTIETVIILPLLMWGVLATYTFVDGYRMQSLNLRATYTLSDLISRQWDPVGSAFVNGMGRFHSFLTNAGHDTSLRITVVYWDEPSSSHRLVWSYSTEPVSPAITAGTIATLSPVIPALANADSAIVVETWMHYEPPFSIGLAPSTFENRVIVSPRFVPQLVWKDGLAN